MFFYIGCGVVSADGVIFAIIQVGLVIAHFFKFFCCSIVVFIHFFCSLMFTKSSAVCRTAGDGWTLGVGPKPALGRWALGAELPSFTAVPKSTWYRGHSGVLPLQLVLYLFETEVFLNLLYFDLTPLFVERFIMHVWYVRFIIPVLLAICSLANLIRSFFCMFVLCFFRLREI